MVRDDITIKVDGEEIPAELKGFEVVNHTEERDDEGVPHGPREFSFSIMLDEDSEFVQEVKKMLLEAGPVGFDGVELVEEVELKMPEELESQNTEGLDIDKDRILEHNQ